MSSFTHGKVGTLLALCALVVGTPGAALAWAAGTHAYIAKHTDKKAGLGTDRELCRRVLGANGPDLFNFPFTDATQAAAGVLHLRDPSANLAPWYAARTSDELALGLGFANHNNAWGSDATAHFDGVTAGNTNGYVIEKAAILGDQLLPVIWPQFPFLPEEAARALSREVSHNFVELAVDFLLAEADPALGEALAGSASCYDAANDPDFLVYALGPYLAPGLSADPATGAATSEAMIRAFLPRFVQGIAANGRALAVPYQYGLPMIAHATAIQAVDFLAYKRLPPPPADELEPLIAFGIDQAVKLCRPDVLDEIEATIGRVNGKMSSEGISP